MSKPAPRSVTNVKPSIKALKALNLYLEEMRLYREQRNRPNNPLYYVCKLAEEAGEVAEAAVALDGSRRKIKKFKEEGKTPLEAFKEELADILNVAFLAAEQRDINPEDLLLRAAEKMEEKRIGAGGGKSGE